MGHKEPPRLGSTICSGQTWARKSQQDSTVRFVTAKSWPERATKTRQYDLLNDQELARKSNRDSAVRFVTAKSSAVRFVTAKRGPKSHQDSAVRFGTAKHGPERATKTRQYDLLRPRLGQKEPPRLGSTICYGQTWARKSHQDSAVRFVTTNSWPERATETRQYDLLRPKLGQKEPPRLGSTICYGQTWARKSHQDCPEKAAKTRQNDLLRRRAGKKGPLRLGSTFCSGQTWARMSHQDSAIRFVTAKRGPERATETRQYDLLRPRAGQKKPPRLGSTARKSHQDSAVRFVTAKSWPERATKTRQISSEKAIKIVRLDFGQTWARKSHQDSAVRFVTARVDQKEPPYGLLQPEERATETRQYDLLRPRVGQKEPPRLGTAICYGQELARKSHQDPAVRFVAAVRFLLRPKVGQKEPPRLGSTICYGQELTRKSHRTTCYSQTLARKSHQDSAVRFVTAKDSAVRFVGPNVGQKEPPRLDNTICYGQTLARKSHQDSAVRFVTAKRGPERATETRQYDLLRPNVGQKEPPRLGSTICYGQDLARKIGSTICSGQTWARKSHQDSAVRFVTAKSWPERAIKTVQKKPPRLGNMICSICYGQELARKSHQDSAVRFVTAKRGPEKATKTRQYDLYGQEFARKSHQDSAVRFVTATSWPERATETRQYDLLRPRVVQKESP